MSVNHACDSEGSGAPASPIVISSLLLEGASTRFDQVKRGTSQAVCMRVAVAHAARDKLAIAKSVVLIRSPDSRPPLRRPSISWGMSAFGSKAATRGAEPPEGRMSAFGQKRTLANAQTS